MLKAFKGNAFDGILNGLVIVMVSVNLAVALVFEMVGVHFACVAANGVILGVRRHDDWRTVILLAGERIGSITFAVIGLHDMLFTYGAYARGLGVVAVLLAVPTIRRVNASLSADCPQCTHEAPSNGGASAFIHTHPDIWKSTILRLHAGIIHRGRYAARVWYASIRALKQETPPDLWTGGALKPGTEPEPVARPCSDNGTGGGRRDREDASIPAWHQPEGIMIVADIAV